MNFFEVEDLNKWLICCSLSHIARPPFAHLYILNAVTNLETQEQTSLVLTTLFQLSEECSSKENIELSKGCSFRRWTFYNDQFWQLGLAAMCLPVLPVGGYLSRLRVCLSQDAFIAARLDFQLLGISTSLKPSGSIRRAVLFVGVLLKKRFLPTSYSPVDFLKMSFLVYIGNNYLSHPLRGLQEPDLTTAHSRWLSCVRPNCRLDMRKKFPICLQEAAWLCSWPAVPLVLLVLIIEVMPYSTVSHPHWVLPCQQLAFQRWSVWGAVPWHLPSCSRTLGRQLKDCIHRYQVFVTGF